MGEFSFLLRLVPTPSSPPPPPFCSFKSQTDVVNLLSPLPAIGGAVNVLNTLNWTQMLPVMENYPGLVDQGASWWDAYNSLASTGRLGNAWTITYDDVEEPAANRNASLLQQTVSAYSQLVRGSRDEIRVIEPGLMLGQVFRRPNSYLNPLPLPMNSGIRFALMQVCGRNGDFATGGNQRNFRPT